MNRQAKWICSPECTGMTPLTFHREIDIRKPLKKATLTVSALGVYAARLDDSRIGNAVLTPGWTDYRYRVQEQRYDVCPLLTPGKHRLDIGLAMGWFHFREKTQAEERPALIAALELCYADGEKELIATDTDWEIRTSRILYSSIYDGETLDLTVPVQRFGTPVCADVSFRPIPQVGEWITEQERLAPVRIFTTPKGERLIDFGQNLTGYVELRLKAPRGSRVVLHHAEVLDRDGNFYDANMRGAKNEIVYVLNGEDAVLKPTFTFEGFRYVQLVEYPFEAVDPDAFRAIVVHSDMKRTGDFHCGNEKINQLYHNIIWGQKSNYLDVPTDCPQRDERLGWAGDAQVFFRTAAINFDVERFFEKWLGDLRLGQNPDGGIPDVIPALWNGSNSAAWADVATVIPLELYLAYGNRKELETNYPMMQKWVEYMHHTGPEEFLWLGGWHYGDWLAMDGDPDSYIGMTSKDFIASAYFAYSTSLLIRAGKILGKDMGEYEALYGHICDAIRARYYENGTIRLLPDLLTETNRDGIQNPPKDTQTAYALALRFGLCNNDERKSFSARLAEMIRENGTRMTTGFVGTPYLLHALSENGYTDLAYDLLFQEKSPSWLYSVLHGATTMWEHWNGLKEDGTFWSADMNSFNHSAYGAVFDWIFGVTAGIKLLDRAPAYREFTLEPHPDRRLGFADTSIATENGILRSHWYYKEDAVYYEFTVPAGSVAYLTLPSGYTETLRAGTYHFAE